MTHAPINIRKLSVEAFRGVQTRLDMEFQARLTVLLAPNGTGKTTICNAVEWLLTGEVRGFEESHLRCLTAAEDAATRVTARVDVGTAPWDIERYPGEWRVAQSGNKVKKFKAGALLEQLAPEAGSEENGQAAASIRRSWLSGTRFLPGHDLALLLDDGDESLEGRKRVFADLFGVQALAASIRQIERYLAEVRSEYRQVMKQLPAEGTPTQEVPPPPQPQAAGIFLGVAAHLLGVEGPAAEGVDALTAELARRQSLLRSREGALERVRSALPHLAEMEADRSALLSQLASVQRVSRRAGQRKPRVEAIHRRVNREFGQFTQKIGNLRRLRDQIEEALAGLDPGEPIHQQQSVEELRNGLSADSRYSDRQWLAQLTALIAEVPRYEAALAERATQESQPHFRSEPLDEDDLEDAEERLAALRDNQAYTASRLNMLSGPFGELRLASRAVLKVLEPANTTCPTCGHDWKDASALGGAIEQTIAAVDPLIRAIEVELAEAKAKADLQQEKVDILRWREHLMEAWGRANDTIAIFGQRAAALGLSDRADQWKEESKLAERHRKLSGHLSLIDEACAAIGLANAPEGNWGEVLRVLHRRIDSLIGELEHLRSRADQCRERAVVLLTRLDGAIRAGESSPLGTRLAGVERGLADLNRDWQTLSDKPICADEVTLIDRNLKAEADLLLSAQSQLDGARASLAYAKEVARRERERSRHEHLRQRARKLDERIKLAQSLKDRLTTHRDGFIRHQLSALMPTVRSLFSRVHANHVFDTILHGDESDPLKWFAEIDGNKLPAGHFSQGQRQDLALAIFLARACTLRGTFFLDEPLVHLDDLNRVAVLDILRAIAISQPQVNLVLTTASRPLARHIKEKFCRLERGLLDVRELQGDPRSGGVVFQAMQ